MDYNTMDYIPNGIIISNIKESKIIYINKSAKQILKIDDKSNITSIVQLISSNSIYNNLKKRIIEDNEIHGKSEGVAYLKAFNNTIIEVSFVGIAKVDDPNIVTYIFNKAIEVVAEYESSFKELKDKLPSGIIVKDINNELTITDINDEHCKILELDNNNESHLLKEFIFEEDLNWVMAEIYRNFSTNEDIDIEFRMKSKSIKEKWVSLYGSVIISENGEKALYASMKNLGKRNHINDKLHMERVLFHKVSELTEDRLFRIDLTTNILHLLGSKSYKFGEIAVFDNYKEKLLKNKKIYVEDIKTYKKMVNNMENGIEKSVEIRYLSVSNEYEWYKIIYSFIRNSYGKPVSVVGKVMNINSQKVLEEQARTDLLTNFYNKMTTENEINKLFHTHSNQTHAFFIIDIDNFKAVNDNLGHHFGDIVLSDIANDIKSCFRTKDILGRICGRLVYDKNLEIGIRKKDILGRIGGDEFIIVMRNIESEEIALEKAQVICSMLSKTFTNKDKSSIYSISASIGISMYPKDGTSYEELYKKSDIALYDIKKTSKNGYKLYSDKIIDQTGKHIIKSNDIENYYKVININTMVISSVLNLLYETKDLSTSISAILMYIGNIYKVDRCYIFEATENENSYENRYKWVKQDSKRDVLDGIDNKNLNNILNEVDANGIFYTNDIYSIKDEIMIERLEKEEVKSLFLVESLKNNSERLILGLEDCTSSREWNEGEVATLLHIGRLIFTAVNNDNTINRIKPLE